MNKENVLKIASGFLGNITSVGDDVYRGELNIGDKNGAGIFFLDLTENVPFENFNDYQEKLLADEYYGHPGSLQWNYYLFLLQESVDPNVKNRIERNDKYARKYVLSESDFEKFFKLEKPTAQVTGNIVLDWKKQLDAMGLNEVYTKLSYTSAVDNFVKNSVSKIPKVTVGVLSGYNEVLNSIDRLTMHESYRKYPKTYRQFSFGKVNLFRGTNGVGKTSVFEAIELVACGKNQRNMDKKPQDNCLEAIINNNLITPDICTPSKSEKYRNRDFFWYNNEYPKDNFTVESFNRFNFFNTDAAINFSNSNNEDDIRRSLFNLILGAEYNYITERVVGFFDRLKPIYNQLKSGINNAEQKINEATSTIERLNTSSSIQDLKIIILVVIDELRFVDKSINIDQETTRIDTLCNELKSLFETFLKDGIPFIRSYDDLKLQKKDLETKNAKFLEFRYASSTLTKKIDDKNKELSSIIEKRGFIDLSIEYLNNPRSLELVGLNIRILANEKVLKDISMLNRVIGALNIQEYSVPQTLKDFTQKNAIKLSDAKAELAEIEMAIRRVLESYGKIGKIVSEIKILGKEYLSLNNELNACPLCQTEFERDVLIEHISRELSSGENVNSQIEALSDRLPVLKDQIESMEMKSASINSIRSAYAILSNNNCDEMALDIIVTQIQDLISSEPYQVQVQSELSGLIQWAQFSGFSEQELLFLNEKIRVLFDGHLEVAKGELGEFIRENERLKNLSDQLQSEISGLAEDRAKLIGQVKSDLSLLSDKEYKPSDVANMLQVAESELLICEDSFRRIREIISFEDGVFISDILLKLSTLENHIKTFKSEFQNQFELKNAIKEKETARKFIEDNTATLEKVEKGYALLKDLSENTGTAQLDLFFEQNLSEVNEIFSTIHSPKEFSSIRFENKQLLLIKGDEKMRVSEISTGQRAALAISLFLSLNRKLKNGPNLIMFDDPVSHIDDFNALSFLDFLRFFVLKEGKQIFFATANARLADLVEKKFSFLGEGFKQWELKRDTIS